LIEYSIKLAPPIPRGKKWDIEIANTEKRPDTFFGLGHEAQQVCCNQLGKHSSAFLLRVLARSETTFLGFGVVRAFDAVRLANIANWLSTVAFPLFGATLLTRLRHPDALLRLVAAICPASRAIAGKLVGHRFRWELEGCASIRSRLFRCESEMVAHPETERQGKLQLRLMMMPGNKRPRNTASPHSNLFLHAQTPSATTPLAGA
jgi:hypothetical protein